MRLFAIALMLSVGSILIFGGTTVSAQEKKENKNKSKVVLIKKGDSLSKIAKKNETTYKRLFNANESIKNPNLIYPGDKVRIPKKNEKLKNRFKNVNTANTTSTQPKTTNSGASYSANRPIRSSASANYSGGVWDRLAACESGGNWSINTGNGYYGGLQFNLGTWRANGGSGYPHQASRAEQIRVAKNLHASRGFSPWPACSAKLGLR